LDSDLNLPVCNIDISIGIATYPNPVKKYQKAIHILLIHESLSVTSSL